MTTFPEDFRTFLIASTSLADSLGSTVNVHYNHVPQHISRPYIWYRTASDTVPRCMDKTGGIHQAFLDVEVVGPSEIDAQAVADHLHAKVDGYKGTVGNSSAQGMFLRDKDDAYEPRNINDDDGRHVCAYDLEVWYTT